MKRQRLAFGDAAVADILEQAEWYQHQSGDRLAKRWEGCRNLRLTRHFAKSQLWATLQFQIRRASGYSSRAGRRIS